MINYYICVMSETKTVTVETVQQDKVITIEISGFFYQRFYKFVTDYLDIKGADDYLKVFQKLADEYMVKVPEDDESLNLETLLILIRTMEEGFTSAGFVDKQDVDVPVEPDTKTQH